MTVKELEKAIGIKKEGSRLFRGAGGVNFKVDEGGAITLEECDGCWIKTIRTSLEELYDAVKYSKTRKRRL